LDCEELDDNVSEVAIPKNEVGAQVKTPPVVSKIKCDHSVVVKLDVTEGIWVCPVVIARYVVLIIVADQKAMGGVSQIL
jgi:hypothetical protein